jgi:transcription elongation factor/antiterminator RfaH
VSELAEDTVRGSKSIQNVAFDKLSQRGILISLVEVILRAIDIPIYQLLIYIYAASLFIFNYSFFILNYSFLIFNYSYLIIHYPCTMTSSPQWYVVYTTPRAEKKVAVELERKSIDYYLPLQTILKQWSDRKKKVSEPLFKSYLFVCIDYETEHVKILETPGIVKFVRIGKELTPVRAEIIQAIRWSLEAFQGLLTSSERFKPEEQVEIIAGPMTGLKGIVTQLHGNHYVAVNVEQLGTHLLLKVPTSHLQKIG